MAQTDLEQPQTTADGRTDGRWMSRLWNKVRSAVQSIVAPAAGITVTTSGSTATLALANDLAAVEGLAGTGLATRTATDTWTTRTVTGTANEITATNGDGVSGNPTLSLPSALTFTGKTVTGGAFESTTIGGTTPGAGTFTTLASTGNTTLGDSAADSLTINAGTWTLPASAVTATTTAGTVAAGTVQQIAHTTTFTGDSGGTTNLAAHFIATDTSGANNISNAVSVQGRTSHGGSGTASNIRGLQGAARNTSNGSVTNLAAVYGALTVSGSGNVTNAQAFNATTPSITSTGAITNIFGFNAENLGHATLITNAIGFSCSDFTAASTFTAAFRSLMTSGTGKWGFYASGSANNAFSGATRFGSTTAPVNTVDITGSFGRGAPVTKTADFTVAATENWLINNKSGSACTVTLPTASSWTGREIMIQSYQAQATNSASSNVVPLGGGAAGTAILAATAGKWATLVSDGTNWIIMQGA